MKDGGVFNGTKFLRFFPSSSSFFGIASGFGLESIMFISLI